MTAMKEGQEHRVYLGLGSNISPEENVPRSIKLLRQYVQVDAVSTTWNTRAVGTTGPDFVNAAASIRTHLSPEELKYQVMRRIEEDLGRVRTSDKYAPRPIDIDILIYDDQLMDPEVWTQAHIAVPLAELIPGYTHNESGETLSQAAQRLSRKAHIHPHSEVLGN